MSPNMRKLTAMAVASFALSAPISGSAYAFSSDGSSESTLSSEAEIELKDASEVDLVEDKDACEAAGSSSEEDAPKEDGGLVDSLKSLTLKAIFSLGEDEETENGDEACESELKAEDKEDGEESAEEASPESVEVESSKDDSEKNDVKKASSREKAAAAKAVKKGSKASAKESVKDESKAPKEAIEAVKLAPAENSEDESELSLSALATANAVVAPEDTSVDEDAPEQEDAVVAPEDAEDGSKEAGKEEVKEVAEDMLGDLEVANANDEVGYISGTVYYDMNSDGKYSAGTDKLAKNIDLTLEGAVYHPGTKVEVKTNADGTFKTEEVVDDDFKLIVDNSTVKEISQLGFYQKNSVFNVDENSSISKESGQDVTGVFIGLVPTDDMAAKLIVGDRNTGGDKTDTTPNSGSSDNEPTYGDSDDSKDETKNDRTNNGSSNTDGNTDSGMSRVAPSMNNTATTGNRTVTTTTTTTGSNKRVINSGEVISSVDNKTLLAGLGLTIVAAIGAGFVIMRRRREN